VRTAGAAAMVCAAMWAVFAPASAAPVNVAAVTLQLDGPVAAGGTAHLSGEVSLAAAGAGVPLAPVQVTLTSDAGSVSASATTDGSGHFAVAIGVPAAAKSATATAYLLKGSLVEAASPSVTVLQPAATTPTTSPPVTGAPPPTLQPPTTHTTRTSTPPALLSVRIDPRTPQQLGHVERFRSQPAGIDCERECIAVFPVGTVVSLEVDSPTKEEFLSAWGGACAGQPPAVCRVRLTSDREVTALIGGVLPITVTTPTTVVQPPVANRCARHQPCRLPTVRGFFGHLPPISAVTGALAGFVLLAFPGALFTATLEENYETVRAWFGRRGAPVHRRPAVVLTGVSLVVGFAWWLGRGEHRGAAANVAAILGVAAAFAVITLVAEVPEMLTARAHRADFEGVLRALPGTAVLSLTAGLVSNILHLEPGYVFGTVAGFAVIRGRRTKELGGQSAAFGAAALFGVGMLAWITWGALQSYVERGHPGAIGPVFAGQFMEVLVLGCIEAIAFAYLPLRFMDGARVREWNRQVWLVIQGAALVLAALLIAATGQNDYIEVLEDKHPGATVKALIVALAFGAFSVGFWAYFRLREGAGPVPAAAGGGEDADHEDVDQLGDEVLGVVGN